MLRPRYLAVLLLVLTVTMFALPALAQSDEDHHALVQVQLNSATTTRFLQDNQHKLDIVFEKPGHFVHIAAQPKQLQMLRDAGLDIEILEPDMERMYAGRSKGEGFGLFHTFSENIAFVDSLRMLYPDVISEKWSLGQSGQGRDIWAFRVSDNPDVDEDEPEILIDGMHHAREIMASEFPIMFAEYLASNYGTDPEITWLLNNRELYIVPVVNPDGFVYNEQNDPNGGGMWRKNRRNNGDGTYGVDPNRNYPYEWDGPGSSTDPGDLTYRGPYGGSEPEVQCMMSFINNRNFISGDSVHTYSNLLLYPWGYTTSPSPDDLIFDHMAAEMVKYNGYAPGQPGDLLYDVNGGSFDWGYGAQFEHAKMYTFSSEIGGSNDGFWPDESRRGALFQENIWPHIYLMRVSGEFVEARNAVVNAPSKSIQPGESGTLSFTVDNPSVVASLVNLNLTISSDDPWIQLGASTANVATLAAMNATTVDAIPVSVDAACPDGHAAGFTVTAHLADGDLSYNPSFIVGSPNIIFADDFSAGTGNWITTGTWGTTSSESHSPTMCLADSPSGNYSNQTETYAEIDGDFLASSLSFWHKYVIEDGWDFGYVQISADGGPWINLMDYTDTQSTWAQVTFDLSDYEGQMLRFRFHLSTDWSEIRAGWHIDDVEIQGAGSDNLAPATPLALSPVGNQTVDANPVLTVANSYDPEGADVVYGFRVYSDEACVNQVAGTVDLIEGTDQTSWTAPTLAQGQYWWRAWAGDSEQRSALSAPETFIVSGATSADGWVLAGPQLKVLDGVSGQGARLELSLPTHTNVTLDIYDARGARVRSLHSGGMSEGVRTLVWDGRDHAGRNTSSGVYFVRMQAGGAQALTGRVVVVR